MKRYVIILAGGSGTRMGAEMPKQFLPISQKPILLRTVEQFYSYDPTLKIIVVLPYDQREMWNDILQKFRCKVTHETVVGGNERFFSAQAGVIRAKRTAEPNDLIAIHDGVRPFVSFDTIERCFESAKEFGTGIAYRPMTDSLRQMDEAGGNRAVDRSRYAAIATPQAFRAEVVIESYKQPYKATFTDDASVVENAGFPIRLVESNMENIKITTPIDLLTANAILKMRKK